MEPCQAETWQNVKLLEGLTSDETKPLERFIYFFLFWTEKNEKLVILWFVADKITLLSYEPGNLSFQGSFKTVGSNTILLEDFQDNDLQVLQ